MERIVPSFSFFDHGVDDAKQLSHRGNKGYFFCLTSLNEPRIKDLNRLVIANGRQCCHVQSGANACSTAENRPFASHFSRVPVNGSYANKSGYRSSGKCSKLRNLSKKARDCRISDAFDGVEKFRQFNKMDLNVLPHLNINEFKLSVQGANNALNAFHYRWMGCVDAISLRDQHGYQLATTDPTRAVRT